MTSEQQQKIRTLLAKYNDVLLHSMRLAVAEDFINLLILNRDDGDFELNEFLQNKNDYYDHIFKEFLRLNSSSVVDELKQMDDPLKELKAKIGAGKTKGIDKC